ncbi:3-oxoacyl-[acyl-carrier protein] reductase [Catenuloplanes nepalensis]|uniref:3-oxoacyl-[acyl-carrier protein] reductase n=1 Tax=Catenuloplanes nepalensis TaxID=587533 RepID=A0ABT9MU01_9ACTN|nr:SDR family oxidoreductase [Catenuloplanes nepalensis]MDP9794496.1 3-oxoacyl-[acyl-carrier protein] reductase [Catenuloplanes nepalensis]
MSRHIALVTGANQGIGAAVAEALAARGDAVLLTGLAMPPSAHRPDPTMPAAYAADRATPVSAVADRINAAGGTAAAVEADLSGPDVAGPLFDAAEEHFGPVDILVNNASGWLADTFSPDATDTFGRPLTPVTVAGFDRQFAVDTRAPALLIAEFARRHALRGARWGRIVGLTSGSAHGFPGEASYGAAKAAHENYTMTAATELAPLGITANMVHPPVTDTGWITDAVASSVEADPHWLGVAAPSEVAEVIAWLTSDAARRITGHRISMR